MGISDSSVRLLTHAAGLSIRRRGNNGSRFLVSLSWRQRKLRSLGLRLIQSVENNENMDYRSNGEEHFIHCSMARLAELREPVTVVDVGANVGNYTRMVLDAADAAALAISVFAFEPTRVCLTQLASTIAADPRVTLVPVAASDRAGSAVIYYDVPGSGLASLEYRKVIDPPLSETVQVIRLDEYFSSLGVSHVSLLKLDVEGHEMRALAGLGSYLDPSCIDLIQFEYGGANLDSRTTLMDLYGLLEEAGFVLAKMLPHGLEVRHYSQWMENYQNANYVALAPRMVQHGEPVSIPDPCC